MTYSNSTPDIGASEGLGRDGGGLGVESVLATGTAGESPCCHPEGHRSLRSDAMVSNWSWYMILYGRTHWIGGEEEGEWDIGSWVVFYVGKKYTRTLFKSHSILPPRQVSERFRGKLWPHYL